MRFKIIPIAGVYITTCLKAIPIAGAKADRRRAKAKAGAKAESLISSFAYTKRKFQTYFLTCFWIAWRLTSGRWQIDRD